MKTEQNSQVVICPPCGENVGLPTKRGANKENLFLPLLPRRTAVLPPQGREITTCGFTLIELLVVVLIIGILAAVALPQYQKAVEKSRASEMLSNVKTLRTAREVYILTHGTRPTSMEDLDVTVSRGSTNIEYKITGGGNIAAHRSDNSNVKMYSIQYNPDMGFVCNTYDSTHNHKGEYEYICKSLSSEKIQSDPYAVYKLGD